MHDESEYVKHLDIPDESFPIVLYSVDAVHMDAGSGRKPDRMGW